MSYLFAFSYYSWDTQGKNAEVVCHSLLQWTTFCQNSPPRPIHLGWPYMAWKGWHLCCLVCTVSSSKLWVFFSEHQPFLSSLHLKTKCGMLPLKFNPSEPLVGRGVYFSSSHHFKVGMVSIPSLLEDGLYGGHFWYSSALCMVRE